MFFLIVFKTFVFHDFRISVFYDFEVDKYNQLEMSGFENALAHSSLNLGNCKPHTKKLCF